MRWQTSFWSVIHSRDRKGAFQGCSNCLPSQSSQRNRRRHTAAAPSWGTPTVQNKRRTQTTQKTRELPHCLGCGLPSLNGFLFLLGKWATIQFLWVLRANGKRNISRLTSRLQNADFKRSRRSIQCPPKFTAVWSTQPRCRQRKLRVAFIWILGAGFSVGHGRV